MRKLKVVLVLLVMALLITCGLALAQKTNDTSESAIQANWTQHDTQNECRNHCEFAYKSCLRNCGSTSGYEDFCYQQCSSGYKNCLSNCN